MTKISFYYLLLSIVIVLFSSCSEESKDMAGMTYITIEGESAKVSFNSDPSVAVVVVASSGEVATADVVGVVLPNSTVASTVKIPEFPISQIDFITEFSGKITVDKIEYDYSGKYNELEKTCSINFVGSIHYSGKAVAVTYGDVAMSGKTTSIVTKNKLATITLTDVVPGVEEIVLKNVVMGGEGIPSDFSFEGNQSVESSKPNALSEVYYKGLVKDGTCTIKVNVTYPESFEIVGKWNVTPDIGDIISIEWKSDAGGIDNIPVLGVVSISQIVSLLNPILNKLFVDELGNPTLIKDFSFLPDGNFEMTVADGSVKESNNVAMYCVETADDMRLYLEADVVIELLTGLMVPASKNGRAEGDDAFDVGALIVVLLDIFTSFLNEGIEMTYKVEGDKASVSIDLAKQILPLFAGQYENLGKLILSFITDPKVEEEKEETGGVKSAEDDLLGSIMPYIEDILPSLLDCLEKSTKLEITFNLQASPEVIEPVLP